MLIDVDQITVNHKRQFKPIINLNKDAFDDERKI